MGLAPGGLHHSSDKPLIAPTFAFAGLFACLFHQLLMAGQAFAQFLQAFAQLLAVTDLIFDLVAQLFAQLITFLGRNPGYLLLLFALLLLVLLPRLLHVLEGLLNFRGQTLMQASPLLFQDGAAILQLILNAELILLLGLVAFATLSQRGGSRAGQHCCGDGNDSVNFHGNFLFCSTVSMLNPLLQCACHPGNDAERPIITEFSARANRE